MCPRIAGATGFSRPSGLVLGVLVELEDDVRGSAAPCRWGRRRSPSCRLQGPLVAVEDRAPGILGVAGSPQVRCSRRRQVGELEVARLGVGDVRLARPVDQEPPVERCAGAAAAPSIRRTMSSMWMHMSPMMPLPYSMNARQLPGCVRAL